MEADRDRIGQVISNLLSNAIKFTRREGGIVTVEVQKKDHDNNGEIKNDKNISSTVYLMQLDSQKKVMSLLV